MTGEFTEFEIPGLPADVVTAAATSRSHWDIDPATTYLNHGSFGPSPREVRDVREAWTRRLERQPMRFFCREMEEELDRTTAVLAEFLGTKSDRLALVDNATVAMNIVAETVVLAAGDEVLLTDHEYGAVRNIWSQRCQQAGAKLIIVELPFPPIASNVVDTISAKMTEHTKLIVMSHVTSPTACILPVRDVCDIARRRGVAVCIDGPHAVAMLDVRPEEIGCDFFCASCHKWLCAAFGSGFLWMHPKHTGRIRCPNVSWGGSLAGRPASWKDRVNWLGTRDPAALLSISAAVKFFTPERLRVFRTYAHALAVIARRELLSLSGTASYTTPAEDGFVSMFGIELPQSPGWKPGYHGHPDTLAARLRDEHGIEVLSGCWNNRRFLRASFHLYNTLDDVRRLTTSVREVLKSEVEDLKFEV